MSGLDKITSQIREEAEQNAQSQVEEAKASAEKLLKEAESQAAEETEAIRAKAQTDIDAEKSRAESSCDMQRKRAILEAKQEIISEVLESAYERVVHLPDGEYFDFILDMLKKYVTDGEGEIYFNEKDLSRLPGDFEKDIQDLAKEKGGKLSLAEGTRPIDGGFVLVYGGKEENCTIRALFDGQKDDLTDQAQKLLF